MINSEKEFCSISSRFGRLVNAYSLRLFNTNLNINYGGIYSLTQKDFQTSRLGGVVVSVLATAPTGLLLFRSRLCHYSVRGACWHLCTPTGRGFELGRGDGFLRAIKIRSTISFAWEVKPDVPCRKI
jgi:hypothetical protein